MGLNIVGFSKELIAICQRDTGAQNLPVSSKIFWVSIGCYTLCRFWIAQFNYSILGSLFIALFDIFLLALMVVAPLSIKDMRDKIQQTLIGLASVGTLISLTEVIAEYVLGTIPFPGDQPQDAIIIFLTFPLLLWRILVNITIMRHALSWQVMPASLLVDAQVITVIMVGKGIARHF
ncbi:hypothetical protein [Candidatus Nitrosacidococcus tergens]|uniref:Uncharacterized protein n=1 Tax=Candidatus Nitrosacidococcus tergens TaxID=553981 RepID=A0A7G1Q9Z3_9GAMM|nr:hypothetical protein [Candidatus Nitrosacidococcus tergens]CAB1275651.1 conserved membrane protein of unknown function [Candidatus Nitrosacidococcus tergens]